MGRKRLESVVVESGAVVQVGSDVVLQVEGEDEPCVAVVSNIFVDKKDRAKFSVYWYYFPEDVKRGRQSYHAQDEIFRSDHHQLDPLISSKTVIWTCAVLPLGKWVAFLNSPFNPNGQKNIKGPIPPEPFDPEIDLAACKSLGRPDLLSKGKEDVSGMNRKEGHAESNRPKTKKGSSNSKDDDDEEDDFEEDKNRIYMCRHEYQASKEQWKDEEVPVFCICDLPYNPDKIMIQCSNTQEWYHPECVGVPEEQVERILNGEPWYFDGAPHDTAQS